MKLVRLLFLLGALTLSSIGYSQCSTTSTPTNNCSYGDAIDAFTLAGTSSNHSGCNSNTATGYSFYSTPVRNLTIGSTYSWSASVGGYYGYDEGVAIWIDLNGNNQYESSEMLASTSPSTSHSGSITIPVTATAGTNVRMRVRCAYLVTMTGGQACTNSVGSYGETEDYYVNLIAPPPCSGTPSPGNTLSTANVVCNSSTSFTLSLQNATSGTGVTYQWQSSSNGSTWSNIGGATSSTLTTTQTASTYYRCNVTCSGNTGTSNSKLVSTSFLACYCTATTSSGCIYSDDISNVTLGTLNNSTGCTAAPAYVSYIGSVAAPSINIGSTNSMSVTVGAGGNEKVTVWVDYDHSGTFDASEYTYLGTGSGTTITGNLVIPATALTGSTAMRVRCTYGSTPPSSTQACTNFSYGETEDYEVNLVCPAISIATHPSNTTICPNSNASFTVASTTGAGLTATYQWQVSTGGAYTNVTNTGVYSGATTSTLTLTNAPNTMNGYTYRCVADNPCGNSVYSSAGTLNFYTPAVITTQPSSINGCPNGSLTFSIVATGTSMSYQWQLSTNGGGTWNNISNGGVYNNATTTTLSITGLTSGMNNYKYRCVITNPCTTTSSAGTLTILSQPAITGNPSSVTVCTGGNTSFTASATGDGLVYQWEQFNGVSWSNITNGGMYAGANTGTLTLTGVTAGMDGYRYRCRATGTCNPSVTTTEATLTIAATPGFTTNPSSTVMCTSSTGNFSVTAVGYNNTYQWQVHNGVSWANVTNSGVYSGANTTTLSIANPPLTMNGYLYRCVATTACTVSATSGTATLTVATSPTITVQPTNKILCIGDNTTYTTTASSSSTIAYQWQVTYNGTSWANVVNNANYSGATTPTLTVTNAIAGMNGGQYRCALNTGCVPATTTNSASMEVRIPPVLDYSPSNTTVCQGQNAAFVVNATGSLLNFQWQVSTNGGSSWSNISNGSQYSGVTTKTLTVLNAPASLNTYKYRCAISGYCSPSINSGSATLTVNTPIVITSQPTNVTICSGGNASFTVGATGTGASYKWYRSTGTGYVQVTNGGIYSGATTSTLNINGMTAPTSTITTAYYCQISGTCSNATTNTLYLTVHAKPTITTNPPSFTVCDSTQYVDITVAATGTNLSYQWQVNSGAGWQNLSNNSTYSRVTTNAMRIGLALYSMNGYQYRCVVSGTCTPSATSSAATMTVSPLVHPTITITGNIDICTGQSTTLTATITNGGSSPAYLWTRNGNTVGTGSTYTYGSYNDKDLVQCRLTTSVACPAPKVLWSAPVSILVGQYVTPAIYISSSVGDSACSGKEVTFTVDSTKNAGTAPTYQWKVNGVNAGTNSTTYKTTTLSNGDVVTCNLISSLKCLAPAVAGSNALPMIVNPTRSSGISISVTPDSNICAEAEVLIYSKFQLGGPNPTLQWMLNGVDIPGEVGGKLRISTLNDNDVISCKFFSTEICVFPDTSNEITFDVTPLVDPSVNVTVSYSGNNTYTFTASPTNGGSGPSYQWFKNFTAIPGETGTSFTASDLVNSDVIHVEMTSNEVCPRPSLVPALSRYVTTAVSEVKDIFSYLNVYPNPNTGTFTIKGDYNITTNADAEIRVVNALGQNVYIANDKIRGGKLEHRILLNDVAPGVYIVHITADGNKDFRRFTISK
ncbi:MAG: T9SS type A sorting domain-containing protein [Chitinophagales bacterium]|nr:T9SS type A sorting domain-containing protein [Chitinophagales bacterium]